MSLAGWLDAGYAMLVDGADGIWRRLLDNLFTSETQPELETAFAALEAEGRWRERESKKADEEHRRKSGAPVHARGRVAENAVDEAFDEWAQLTKGNSPTGTTNENESGE